MPSTKSLIGDTKLCARLLISIKKIGGLDIDPWGTSAFTDNQSDIWPFS